MLSHASVRRAALPAVIGLGLLAAPRVAGQTYIITELADDGVSSKAYGMNETGQVVGLTRNNEDVAHSSHWLNEVFTDLHGTSHLDLLRQFNGDHSEAYEISNADQIVGTAQKILDCPQGTITTTTAMLLRPAVLTDLATPFPGDALTDLGTFGNPCVVFNSAAVGISNANHVVGWSDIDAFGTVHGFIVTPRNGRWFLDADTNGVNDLMIDLGTMDNSSTESSATAVNDSGVVVGYTYVRTGRTNTTTGIDEAGYHAFRIVPNDTDADGRGDVWTSGGSVNAMMRDLGTLGGNNSWARGINNAGQIVGESDTLNRETRAFLWQSGSMSDLGTLGGANSSASRINDNGDIVGWAENAQGERRAVVWINGEIHDLNTSMIVTANPKIVLTEARDINANGQIAGWGMTRNGTSSASRSFLLRVATAAEIAAAEADIQTPVTAGSTAETGGDSSGGDGGFSGVPLLGPGAGTTSTAGTTADADPNAVVPVISATPMACAFGGLTMLPLTVIGMCMLRCGIRQRIV